MELKLHSESRTEQFRYDLEPGEFSEFVTGECVWLRISFNDPKYWDRLVVELVTRHPLDHAQHETCGCGWERTSQLETLRYTLREPCPEWLQPYVDAVKPEWWSA
jgi:hypothetical protein